MNGELLTALERLEREKGIKKEVLFAAIESALTSAAYKIIDGNATAKDEITVKMNEETGEIKVYKGKQEVKSDQFGRIAAQTAKQVMIQKIREAERDVVYNKYLQMEGTIISGSVHRFEKGNIVVELDDTEGVLLKSGQIPRERFRQGQPIRAFLQKVERKTGGLEIILSRANCGFVQRLFEMEVPEITQGIVEIKAIAREAGERTKIAVESTEDKIDAVGACVGMRGSRVKEIVKELSGERIDIVRWSDDIEEYIKSAVSPAEIYSMEIDSENKTIKLIFPKDQLSALIGKRGRNIRLISKLVGWEIQAEAKEEKIILSLSEVPGINEEVLHILEKAGYNNTSEVVETDVENISVVEGMD
ncbi:MAG TPA: transcription termination factor NusA, partial [Candidatus Omnitrophota bacterium]|nr:transcription termination factor NusA [Candidatus Omnitrophota bacterium]